MGERPADGHLLHQLLEGELPQRDRVQRVGPGAPDQLAEAGLPGGAEPQHQGVDEAADERLDLDPIAVGAGEAEDDVGLAAPAREQGAEGGREHGERRRPLALAEPAQLGHPGGSEGPGEAAPPQALRRGPAVVGRQLQVGWRRQPQPGGGQQPPELLAAQPLTLPDCKVGVLQRQLRQGRRTAGEERLIERRELAGQETGGPAVGNDVMERQDERVLPRARGQQERAQQRPAREVERPFRLQPGQPRALPGAPAGG